MGGCATRFTCGFEECSVQEMFSSCMRDGTRVKMPGFNCMRNTSSCETTLQMYKEYMYLSEVHSTCAKTPCVYCIYCRPPSHSSFLEHMARNCHISSHGMLQIPHCHISHISPMTFYIVAMLPEPMIGQDIKLEMITPGSRFKPIFFRRYTEIREMIGDGAIVVSAVAETRAISLW